MQIKFTERPMTDEEYKREKIVFEEHEKESGSHTDKEERFGYVATDEENNGILIGASSGLAYKQGDKYSAYFYLSDLFVEKEHRRQGYGKKLLELLEEKIKSLGIEFIWTWTASFEGESFYIKQGYSAFTRFENFYPSGHARIGLIKKLL